jgi:hypothetical protein
LRFRSNEEIDLLTKRGDIVRYIKSQRISWVENIVRMDKGRAVKRIRGWKPNAVRRIR